MTTLSVVVVSWNVKPQLKNCLNSILGEKLKDFEVIVVDNASSDGSPQMVERDFPQVKLIKNNQNLGFSKANNQAIKISQGEYILLLNSDTVIQPGAIQKMVNFMDKNKRVGALGCKVKNPDGTLQDSCGRFPSLSAIMATKIHRLSKGLLLKSLASHQVADIEKEVDWITGASLMVRREAIEQVGLLDEAIFMYFEDTDWCYRIKKSGWVVKVTPEAEIIHLGGGSARRVPDTLAYEYRKSQYYLYGKHMNIFSQFLLRMIVTLNSLFSLLRLSLSWFFKANKKKISKLFKAHLKIIRLSLSV
jgi:hypothetical protein